jgi:hypothetical protein
MASAYGDLRHLLPSNYKRLITAWLEEDCPSFDYGGFVVGESEGEARLLGKSKVPSCSIDSRGSMLTHIGYRRRCTLFRRGLFPIRLHVREQAPVCTDRTERLMSDD